ncbi:phage tail domain-containing protein [Clostridium rectalis]|uniref:phage tail domain-containing protein n=1 Tax=Clostridium rectalis TaxID=2040295 RepID=UPI0013DD9A94|nr:phage tail domain-containing protein [Clostridium rectalis]
MYDGIKGSDMGLTLVDTNTDMIESIFGYKRENRIDKINDNIYSYGFNTDPLKFKITLAKITDDDLLWDYKTRKDVVKWLFQDDYKPFISLDNPEVIYYCKLIGDARRFDTGAMQGYITLTMECNSPYAYSPTYIYTWDFSISNSNILEIENLSNVKKYYYPEIEIEMVGDTSIEIENLSNAGEIFKIDNLIKNEIIYVDNNMQRIKSNLPNTYRLDNFNKNWIRLVRGYNLLEIRGDVRVSIRCCYPIAI